MGNLRPVLIIGLVFLAYMMWIEWQKDYGATPQAPTPQAQDTFATQDLPSTAVDIPGDGLDLPEPVEQEPARPDASADVVASAENQPITVKTDVMEARIDLTGGTVVSALLLDYPVKQKDPENKVDLLSAQGDNMFIAQSGLLSRHDAPNHTSLYSAEKTEYELMEGSAELRVPLTWKSDTGVHVTKTFVFREGDYDISVLHQVRNDGAESWAGSRYDQLQRTVADDEESVGFTNPGRYSFVGIGLYNPEDKFEKIDFEDIADSPYKKTSRGGWLSMIQHYFFAAWIPPAEEEVTYSTQAIASGGWPRYIVRNVSPVRQVNPGASTEFESSLYLGPKLQDRLPELATGLEYTVNYGIFTIFSKPLFWLLAKIHSVVGNWGWAIVILTIFIKAAFFKLTEAQYRSTARMRKLQPRIEQLKERFGDDRQRMSQAMMELYKKEKVNPLGGCLPILVQIPIFIALYWVLLESVELRQAPFILWIDNLSVRDPYFILPLLNASFMFATQRLTPMVGMDPLQQKMMTMMPIVFSIMFAFFPAGLVLYWATNAGLSLAQQYYITRKIAASD